MFGEFADVYDSLMTDFDYSAFRDYYKEIFNSYDIEKESLLEFGCGSGTMTELLADVFDEIYALDISRDMLSIAAEKLRNRRNIRLLNIDISEFNSEKKFNAVIACCDVFNYFTSTEIFRRALYSAYSSLEDGGIFLFDLSSVWKFKNQLGNETFIEDSDDFFMVWKNQYDSKKSICEMRLNIFEREGRNYRRIVENQKQRAYNINTVVDMLKKTGFSKVQVFVPLTFDEAHENIPRFQFLALK